MALCTRSRFDVAIQCCLIGMGSLLGLLSGHILEVRADPLPTNEAQENARNDSKPDWKAIISARLESLQDLEVKYDLEEELTPALDVIARIAKENPTFVDLNNIKQGIFQSERRFTFQRGGVQYESRLKPETIEKSEKSDIEYELTSFAEGRVERMWTLISDSHDHAIILEKEPKPLCQIDFGLGLRLYESDDFLTLGTIAEFSQVSDENEPALILEKRDTKGRRHQWTLDPNQQFALTSYRVFVDVFCFLEIINSEFEPVSGVMLPHRIQLRELSRFTKGSNEPTQISKKTATVTSYSLPSEAGKTPAIVYPLHTHILDARTGANFVVKSKPRTLTDSDIRDSIGAPLVANSGHGRFRLILLAINGVIVIGVISILLLKRRRRHVGNPGL